MMRRRFYILYLRRERVGDGYDRPRHAVLGSVHSLEAVYVAPYLPSAPWFVRKKAGRKRRTLMKRE